MYTARQEKDRGRSTVKRLMPLLCMMALCTAAAGCAQETALRLTVDVAQAAGVEIYRFTVPADAEKKVLTQEAGIRGCV